VPADDTEELDQESTIRVGSAWWQPRQVSPDRSLPRPVEFRWLPPPGLRRAGRYDLLLGLDAELTAPLVIRDLAEPLARVRHLQANTDYYWRVYALLDGEPVSDSATFRFRTHPALPRWIRVPHITNVRDLGGWPVPGGQRVRQGLAYRSSEMNSHLSLSPEGVDVLLGELRLRTDLDLRSAEESPSPALPEQWVRHVSIPVLPYDRIASPETMAAYARLFDVLSQADTYPVLMHCWAGADRAATAAFLLHATLGVEFPDLATDYELSSLSLWGKRSRHGADFRALLAVLATHARSPTDSVNQQVANYLRAAGVADATLERLRQFLLEPAPPPPPTSDRW
jgi:protein-tyrosine phosphatase